MCCSAAAQEGKRVTVGDVKEHDLLAIPDSLCASSERTILCVQPNADRQQFLRDALKGYAVEFVATAFDTLRESNARAFDAYVLEYWLPDWSGVSLCRDIRRSDPSVPILFYTSAAGNEPRKRALAAKSTAYVCAPVSTSAFRALVGILISSSDVKSENAASYQGAAIQHELAKHAAVAAVAVSGTRSLAMSMIERVTKIKAHKIFIEHGGTLASFERGWPDAFATAWASLRR
jgi:DNA-binding response OmpR family regulator